MLSNFKLHLKKNTQNLIKVLQKLSITRLSQNEFSLAKFKKLKSQKSIFDKLLEKPLSGFLSGSKFEIKDCPHCTLSNLSGDFFELDI